MNQSPIYDLIVIGGGPAGTTAALRARELGASVALIERGDFDDLFRLFGNGSHQAFRGIYQTIRSRLPAFSQAFWDEKIAYFDSASRKKSFYYYGTSGAIAWILSRYLLSANRNLRSRLLDLLDARTLADQREIYQQIEPALWGHFTSWLVKQPMTMAMVNPVAGRYPRASGAWRSKCATTTGTRSRASRR